MAEVFTPGTTTTTIVDWVTVARRARRRRLSASLPIASLDSWTCSSGRPRSCSPSTASRRTEQVVATTPDEARAAAEQLGGGPVMVKAQVKTGGRGKAGGVKFAADRRRRREKAAGDPRHGHQGPHRPHAC